MIALCGKCFVCDVCDERCMWRRVHFVWSMYGVYVWRAVGVRVVLFISVRVRVFAYLGELGADFDGCVWLMWVICWCLLVVRCGGVVGQCWSGVLGEFHVRRGSVLRAT